MTSDEAQSGCVAGVRAVVLVLLLLAMPAPRVLAESVPDDRLLLEYHRYPLKLGGRDPTPLLRVYESGRVLIYRPAYKKQSGLYELILEPGELEALVRRLEELELFRLDPVQLGEVLERAERASRRSGAPPFASSDGTVSRFHVDLGQGGHLLVLDRLQANARRFPGLQQWAALAQLERRLLTLSQRPERQRVASARPPQGTQVDGG